MLYNGEQHRRRHAAAGRHRRRPDRRHHAHRARPGQRHRRHRRRRAGHDVQPGPVRLHGEDRRRSRGRRRRSTSPRRPPRTSQAVAKAKGEDVARPHRRDPRPPPPRRAHRRGPRRPAPASGSSPTATSPAPSPPPGPSPAPTSCSASAARPRASSPPPRSSAWAARSRAGSGPATTTSARPPSTPATTSTQVLDTDDLVAGDNCFFAATGITDGELLKGVHYDTRGRDHPVAGDALPVGHRAAGQRPPPPQASCKELQLHRVRLTRHRDRRTTSPLPQPPLLEVPRARPRPCSRSAASTPIVRVPARTAPTRADIEESWACSASTTPGR